MSTEELLREIELQRALMTTVSTGGPRIAEVNDEYVRRRRAINQELRRRGIPDPNPFDDLWAWHGKWSGGDLPRYQDRRSFLSDLYKDLTERLSGATVGQRVFEEQTGWNGIDRDMDSLRAALEGAKTTPEFQSVGLHCREILISLAQEVFDASRHAILDGVEPSATDAKRKLDAYINAELSGSSNEALRRHAKAALDASNALQHRRTATFRDAALCAEATTSVVNVIAVIAGRRG